MPITSPSPVKTYRLHDEAGTSALGAALAAILEPGLAIYLRGDLGAGKTALTRAMLHAAGYAGHVKSPTYTLAEPYDINLAERMVTLFHFDLYRMIGADEFLDAGFREYFGPDNICIVEWPEKGDGVLPQADFEIALSVRGDGRDVKLQALSAKGNACLARLKFAPNL